MLFLRVIAWCGDEKFSLKKSCFYLYIRRRHEPRRNPPADSRRMGTVRTSPQKPYVHQDYYARTELYQLMKHTCYPELLPELYFKGLYNKGEVPENFQFRYAMLSQPGEDTIEVSMNDVTIRISNDADPVLLTRTLRLIREPSC